MKSPKTPAAPDPGLTASTQGNINRDTAVTQQLVNMVDQTNPYGSLTYNQTGDRQQEIPAQYDQKGELIPGTGTTINVPRYESVTTLSPEQQQLLDQEQQFDSLSNTIALDQTQRIGDLLGEPVTAEGLPDRFDYSQVNAPDLQQSYVDDFSKDRRRVESALMQRMNPQLERDRQALETSLANKGFKVGSQGYETALDESNRQNNDARLSAILAGGQEQSRMAGLSRDQAQFGNTALQQGFSNQMNLGSAIDGQRMQGIQENAALRNQPINEITALLNGQQIQNPQFQSTPSAPVAGVDYAGLVNQGYQNELGQYNQKVNQQNASMSGLYGLGSSLLGGWALSDRRAKEDIKKAGKLNDGTNIYTYRYKGQPMMQLGVMAQEIEQSNPEAVAEIDGVKHVDYSQVAEAVH